MLKETYYECVEDRQGGTGFVGQVFTIEEGREYAMSGADSDGNNELYEGLGKQKLDENLIKYIDEFGDITLEKVIE